MKIKNMFIAIMLIAFTSVTYSQNCGILDQVVKASGGKEKFESVKSSYMEIKMKVLQGMTMDMVMKVWSKGSDKFYIEQEMMGMNIKMAIDGDKGWGVNPMTGKAEDLPADQIVGMKKQSKKTSNFDFFSNWKKLGYVCEDLGMQDVDEKKCIKVKVTDDEKNTSIYYIDAITNLIYKYEAKENDQDVVGVFKQYQKKDGIFIPKLIDTYVGGTLAATMEFVKVELNIPIDDAKFKKP